MHHTSEAIAYEIKAMIAELQDYLLDDRLFKTVTVSSPSGDQLIKMTIGGLLERMEALQAQEANGDVDDLRAEARAALDRARQSLPERYYEKLGREAKSYTDSWNWFLQNCWEGERRCRSDYTQEVPIRVRLEHLLQEGQNRPELADSRQRIRKLDEQLREIWEEEDAPLHGNSDRYPRDQYWWLYGRPAPQAAR
jgi:ElaB/YqjD/DUF883 family membrane-anchored ribosome-binding protein